MKNTVSKPSLLAVAGIAALLCVACDKTERPAFALTSTGRILGFDTGKPSKLDSEVRVSGLPSGESLVQIDYRPATGSYYGLTNKAHLCTLDPRTGAATLVSSTAFTGATLSNPVIDFNPAADRLRVIASEQNLRVNPIDGSLVATDTEVFFDSDDANDDREPQLTAIAYDQNENGTGTTTLFALDMTTQSLVRVGSRNGSPESPNGGTLFTVARLGTGFTLNSGFDIEPEGDTAYAALSANGEGASLYRLDLKDGSADRVDEIDEGDSTIISLAIGPKEKSGNN